MKDQSEDIGWPHVEAPVLKRPTIENYLDIVETDFPIEEYQKRIEEPQWALEQDEKSVSDFIQWLHNEQIINPHEGTRMFFGAEDSYMEFALETMIQRPPANETELYSHHMPLIAELGSLRDRIRDTARRDPLYEKAGRTIRNHINRLVLSYSNALQQISHAENCTESLVGDLLYS